MELKLLQFGREQLNTETYILKKNRQLYEEAFSGMNWQNL